MRKNQLYLLGIITLLVFPIPTFLVLYFVEGTNPLTLIQFEKFTVFPILVGLALGLAYAGLALIAMQAKVFEKLPIRIETIVRRMKLNVLDCIFLSLCAGIGEELLFRSGFQFYLGPIITSVIFVAIHGYLNPFNWRMSLYGLIVLPFIVMISYGFIWYGLWFAISAHFSYDLLLFLVITQSSDEQSEDDSLGAHTYTLEERLSHLSQSIQEDEVDTVLPEHLEDSPHLPDEAPEADEDYRE